jgi:hypothetical protein
MANSQGFVRTDLEIVMPDSEADFAVVWQLQNASDPKVIIYLRDEVWATMAPGTKPGFCRLAMKDGPLARLLP